MQKNSYVTSYKYLKVKVKPTLPPLLIKILRKLLGPTSSVIFKILGPALGFGRVRNNIYKFPETMVRLKDGTELATSVILPKGVFTKKKKCPTILIRLPYWKDGMFSIFGPAFASYGYAVVMQDVRGCAHSQGFNTFLMADRQDGLETLEWISKRFWFNGKVGMSGGSYFGMTQLLLSYNNEFLTCIAPSISCVSNLWKGHGGLQIHGLTTSIYRIMINISSQREEPIVDVFTNEIQERYLNPKAALYNDPLQKDPNRKKLTELKGKSLEEILKLLEDHYKLDKIDPTKRNFNQYFKFVREFLITQTFEKDGDKMAGLLEMDYKKFSQPAFIQGGWQDMFIEHQLKDFLEIKANASGNSQKSKMVIGDWAHGAKGHPEGSMISFLKNFIKKPWYEYWLNNDKEAYPNIDSSPAIKYWVNGRNAWRDTENWPPENIQFKKLYIHSEGWANSINGNGTLSFEAPNGEFEDRFIFNPMNPVITRGGRNLGILKGAQDQKDAEKRDDVLVYSTEPLDKGIEVTGPVKMILYASSSATDTDFMVKLVDVYPNGKAINLLDAGIRARFRGGEENPSLIEPRKVYEYEINVGNTSNYFRPGHRIRVEISSSNFPRFDINSNMGGEGELGEFKMADQRIFHDKTHPSHIIIPIFK